mmetsp:Transcript_13928/g.13902  ORF Transcript_13928/g.13902 Transcript_13928/m.13902 type:complete len:137 (+) Transcript_13928:520-930(+)
MYTPVMEFKLLKPDISTTMTKLATPEQLQQPAPESGAGAVLILLVTASPITFLLVISPFSSLTSQGLEEVLLMMGRITLFLTQAMILVTGLTLQARSIFGTSSSALKSHRQNCWIIGKLQMKLQERSGPGLLQELG